MAMLVVLILAIPMIYAKNTELEKHNAGFSDTGCRFDKYPK